MVYPGRESIYSFSGLTTGSPNVKKHDSRHVSKEGLTLSTYKGNTLRKRLFLLVAFMLLMAGCSNGSSSNNAGVITPDQHPDLPLRITQYGNDLRPVDPGFSNVLSTFGEAELDMKIRSLTFSTSEPTSHVSASVAAFPFNGNTTRNSFGGQSSSQLETTFTVTLQSPVEAFKGETVSISISTQTDTNLDEHRVSSVLQAIEVEINGSVLVLGMNIVEEIVIRARPRVVSHHSPSTSRTIYGGPVTATVAQFRSQNLDSRHDVDLVGVRVKRRTPGDTRELYLIYNGFVVATGIDFGAGDVYFDVGQGIIPVEFGTPADWQIAVDGSTVGTAEYSVHSIDFLSDNGRFDSAGGPATIFRITFN